jgi:hypothetical protein
MTWTSIKLEDYARKNNLCINADIELARNRINQYNWGVEEALTKPKYSKASIPSEDHLGNKFKSIADLAYHHNFDPAALRILIKTKSFKDIYEERQRGNKQTSIAKIKAPKRAPNPFKNGKVNITRFENETGSVGQKGLAEQDAFLYIAILPLNGIQYIKVGLTYRQTPAINKKLTQHPKDSQIKYFVETKLINAYFAEQRVLKILINNKILLPKSARYTETFDIYSDQFKFDEIKDNVLSILKDASKVLLPSYKTSEMRTLFETFRSNNVPTSNLL